MTPQLLCKTTCVTVSPRRTPHERAAVRQTYALIDAWPRPARARAAPRPKHAAPNLFAAGARDSEDRNIIDVDELSDSEIPLQLLQEPMSPPRSPVLPGGGSD